MVFSSHIFLYYFLPLALLAYYAVPGGFKNLTLTLFSYVFYGWANPKFIFLIAWSTLVDYCCGNFIYGHWRLLGPVTRAADGTPRASRRQRRLFVVLSLVSNLGMLAFFKYFMFAEENLNHLLTLFGSPTFKVLAVALPVGISFYTFESISYNLDIYHGRARPAIVWVEKLEQGRPRGRRPQWFLELKALNAFACYITQFPHLVAGPIIRYQDLEHQIHVRAHTIEKFGRGVFFFSLGFAKKVLIANAVGEIADTAFLPRELAWFDAWWGVLAYAFQIYFDFSGYSDMAVGLGLMLGFEFPINFNSPYKSQSITEFWRRWHISLSTWLRDYLYIPLGGNRKGTARTFFNLVVVMLLGGLWHGAAWTFLIWGAIHGAWLALERVLGKVSFYARAPAVLRVLATFVIVNLAWVFFRAANLSAACTYTASLFGAYQPPPATLLTVRGLMYTPYHVMWMAIAALVAFFAANTWEQSKNITLPKALWSMLLLIWSMVAMSTQSYNPFLYFQF
jgi:alginate O-acetyltransferase complex protein AlgI